MLGNQWVPHWCHLRSEWHPRENKEKRVAQAEEISERKAPKWYRAWYTSKAVESVWLEHHVPGVDSGKKWGWGRSWGSGYDVGLCKSEEGIEVLFLISWPVFMSNESDFRLG